MTDLPAPEPTPAWAAQLIDAVESNGLALEQLRRDLGDAINLLAVIAGTDRYGRPLSDYDDEETPS